MLKDCQLNQSNFGRLTKDEYQILCGFLFPYSKEVINVSIDAIEMIRDPKQYVLMIIKNNETIELYNALTSKKMFGNKSYIDEYDMFELIFEDMIIVEPRVNEFLNALKIIRLELEVQINELCKQNTLNIHEYLEDYIDNNINIVEQKYSEVNPQKYYIEILKDIRKATIDISQYDIKTKNYLVQKEIVPFLNSL